MSKRKQKGSVKLQIQSCRVRSGVGLFEVVIHSVWITYTLSGAVYMTAVLGPTISMRQMTSFAQQF